MQIDRLMKAINPNHVEKKNGLAYIQQHQARAEMIRIFGPTGWDSQVLDMELLYERELTKGDYQYPKNGDGRPYFITCYKASVRVRIRDYWGNELAQFIEYHAEENAPLPNRGEAHAMAITSVESYALRRALIGLGDRLGLGLYDGGSLAPLVVGSLVTVDPDSPLFVDKKSEGDKGDAAPEQKPVSDRQRHFKKDSAPTSGSAADPLPGEEDRA